jgi:hypothetical protein
LHIDMITPGIELLQAAEWCLWDGKWWFA